MISAPPADYKLVLSSRRLSGCPHVARGTSHVARRTWHVARGTWHVARATLHLSLMSRVLVVEDDPDIAELIRHYLEKGGHTVETLGSGATVLPRVRAERPDLIVLDLMLPGLDGLMVCQALRANAKT